MFRRPRSLREAADRVRAGEDFGAALKEFLDQFALAPARAAIADEPTAIGQFEDAYCAALAEHLCLRHGWPVPAWSTNPSRVSAVPTFIDHGLPGMWARLLVESPLAFRKRGIFVDARVGESVAQGRP